MIVTILRTLEYILFLVFAINVLYLLIFSLFALFYNRKKTNRSSPSNKIAILIPAYKEDSVIIECAESCINQIYPKELYDIVVISDKMADTTNESLSHMGIKVLKVNFVNSTKSKALNFAMQEIGDNYDIAVVLDADNVVAVDFLLDINDAFNHNNKMLAVQAHRIAKNTNTDLAYLDSISEEINNTIFRLGHSVVGLSSALIGSGMAFNYRFYKETMITIDAVGGFDKAIELKLTFNRTRIYYLHDTYVLDEKVQNSAAFSRQRRRWISAQFHYFGKQFNKLPGAILSGKIDFCDKMFQQISIPRLILIGGITIFALIITFISPELSAKWWIILATLIFSLLISVPAKLYKWQVFKATLKLPYYFIIFFGNFFRMTNKKFIHTPHGINSNNKQI